MSIDQDSDVLYVADQDTGEILYTDPLGEWFRHDLAGRTTWAAAHAVPASRGALVEVDQRAKLADDDRIVGWRVRLLCEKTPIYSRAYPLDVLRATAATVASQCRQADRSGQVIFWVRRHTAAADPAGREKASGIEFVAQDDRLVRVPKIQTRPTAVTGRVVAPAGSYPTQVVLELSANASAEVVAGIRAERLADKEMAWAGAAAIARTAGDDVLFYHVSTLRRLAAPEASATLCPISPDQLVQLSQGDAPIVFIHTHITAAGDTASGAGDRRLACSQDDLRSFHRLPVGSLGVVAASRPPLRVRVYGWPTNGDGLSELATAITVAEGV